MISVSAIPGGNPVAKAAPEEWALDYGRCTTCNAHWCDRCITKLGAPECPKDKTKFTLFGATPVVAATPIAPPPAAAVDAKPWWKFWG